MRSSVCTLILAAASLAPSALLAQPLEPAAGGATIVATASGKGVAERVVQITASDAAVDSAKRERLEVAHDLGVAHHHYPDLVEVPHLGSDRQRDDVAAGSLERHRALELKERGTAKRERTERDVVERALPGERPAAIRAHEVRRP